MKKFIAESWDVVMDNRHNPLRHLDLASQHYFMQVLGWMWSMVFSLSFLSIFNFGLVWVAHLLVFGGAAFTVAVFREGEKQRAEMERATADLSSASRCVWKLDSEA
ncbi:MAG: hypothetical protein HKN19_14325 [Halioglobus sp.]|nr:hypothetical protein [Halioglobus sp.]